MLEEICIIFITILTCSLAFNLSCPGSGQWNYRAVFYCSDLNKYTCLLDTSKTRYTETCDGSRKETEGHKSTINRNNFDTAKCRPDRFQPIDFITVGSSDCVFQKSKCAQEGQIAAHEIKEKTSLLDTNCLCDYTKGYSFIHLPKDKCYCNPLVDDCSCFREFCPSGKILSPDYQCTTEIDMKNRTRNCPKIASADDGQKGDQILQYIEDIDLKNGRRSRIAVQVIVPLTVFMMVGVLLLIWYWRSSILDQNTTRVTCLDTLFSYGNNSRTSFPDTCVSAEDTTLVPINDFSSDQSLNIRLNQKDTTAQEDECISSEDESYHSALSSEDLLNEINIEDNNSNLDNSTGTIKEDEISQLVYQTEENKSDMKSESYENKNTKNDDQYGAFRPQTGIKSSSLEKNTIDQNDDFQSETPEKDDDKNHDELVTVILDTAADVNGTSKEHIAYAAFEREPENKDGKLLKAIFTTEDDNETNEESEGMETTEVEHDENPGKSEEAILSSDAENGEISIKQQEDNKMKSDEPVCTGDSDYEKAHEKNNDENHDELVEVILTTTAENGTSKEPEVKKTFKKEPEDEDSKSVKTIFDTEADNETNEEYEGLEKSEVVNHGESEEAVLSSDAENGETSIKQQEDNKLKSDEPVCTGDSDYENSPEKNNDEIHDELVEVILTTAAEPETYDTFEREPEDEDGKSVKVIFDTEADNETNEESEGLETPEVEHEEKNGESEVANFSSDVENREKSNSEYETDISTQKKIYDVPEETRTTEIDFETLGDFDSDKEEENDSDVNNASTYQKSVGTEES